MACALLGARCEYRSSLVVDGLVSPVFVTAPEGDPRLFVVERAGRIRIVDARGALLAEPLLDIRDRISTAGERGLLGLAFPPDHEESGAFYVVYTNLLGASQLSRFLLWPGESDRADPASERRLLEVRPPTSMHAGGGLAFGPLDGMLYVGFGDGGGVNDPYRVAQHPRSFLGKLLRIDVSGGPDAPYRVPPDNPWAGDRLVLNEIWAVGLRKPWSFHFDRESGDLWIADPGQDQREELNLEPGGSGGGLNYGWPIHEGTRCHLPTAYSSRPCEDPNAPNRFTFPHWEYAHDQGCAVLGGLAYRGRSLLFPGWTWFADSCSARVWTLPPAALPVDLTARLAPPGGFAPIAALGEDGFGEIHVVGLDGTIRRLELLPDRDRDGHPDVVDVCPTVPDRHQTDTDGDGIGDACTT